MSLPKITHPLFSVKLPSTKKELKLRPMLVKEEKILLMAKEATENNSMILAVKQVVNNCIANADFDLNNLTIFDLDYLFLQIRANSVDSKVQISFEDEEDELVTKKDKQTEVEREVKHTYNVDIDLFEVIVKFPEKPETLIKLGKDSGIKLKYPTIDVYESPLLKEAKTAEEALEEFVINSFESYFEGDKVYNFKDSSREEINEFIDSLNVSTYNKVVEFFEKMPTLYYEVKYKNQKGAEKSFSLNKLKDFFIF